MISAEDVWIALDQLRRKRPLVHAIINYVTMNTVANALLAIGASPVMARAGEEVEDFVALAEALVVNTGTPTADAVAAMKAAADKAATLGLPWVLDPVGAGAVPWRAEIAVALSARAPTVIRGNASEIIALADGGVRPGKGVDAAHRVEEALGKARTLAARCTCVVAVTGAVDHVTDGERTVNVANGHPLMARVTGVGCVGSALVGAFLAGGGQSPLAATAAALTVLGVAGEVAATDCPGPGTLGWRLNDALYQLDRATLLTHARIT